MDTDWAVGGGEHVLRFGDGWEEVNRGKKETYAILLTIKNLKKNKEILSKFMPKAVICLQYLVSLSR